MKTKYLKRGLFFAIVTTSLIACKKKEEKTTEPVEETPTVTCFNSNNNGTYVGSGITTTPFTSGTLTVTRTDCQNVTINLVTDIPSQIISQITQLTLNSSGGYDGKQSNNNDINLTFGSSLSVKSVGSFTFTGVKQP